MERLQAVVTAVRAWPWVVRFILRAGLTLAATVGPLLIVANWLAIGTITEAWPWFLWGEDYLALAEQFFFVARPILTGSLAIVAWWLLGRLLMPRVPPPGSVVRRGLRTLPRVPGFILLLAPSACSPARPP